MKNSCLKIIFCTKRSSVGELQFSYEILEIWFHSTWNLTIFFENIPETLFRFNLYMDEKQIWEFQLLMSRKKIKTLKFKLISFRWKRFVACLMKWHSSYLHFWTFTVKIRLNYQNFLQSAWNDHEKAFGTCMRVA